MSSIPVITSTVPVRLSTTWIVLVKPTFTVAYSYTSNKALEAKLSKLRSGNHTQTTVLGLPSLKLGTIHINMKSPIKVFDPANCITFDPKETYFICMFFFVNIKFSVRYDLNKKIEIDKVEYHNIAYTMSLT